MSLDVIIAQPLSANHATGTVLDEPPSYEDAITRQPRVSRESVEGNAAVPEHTASLREGLGAVQIGSNSEPENNEEEGNKKRNRKPEDDCCYWYLVSDDDDCVLFTLLSNCCISIGNCTESRCVGCADCLHECCVCNTSAENNDSSCCADCCGDVDSGGNSADCDCNCFD